MHPRERLHRAGDQADFDEVEVGQFAHLAAPRGADAVAERQAVDRLGLDQRRKLWIVDAPDYAQAALVFLDAFDPPHRLPAMLPQQGHVARHADCARAHHVAAAIDLVEDGGVSGETDAS